jgi:hypothetical protein
MIDKPALVIQSRASAAARAIGLWFRVLFAFAVAFVLIELAASDRRLPARADTVYRKGGR